MTQEHENCKTSVPYNIVVKQPVRYHLISKPDLSEIINQSETGGSWGGGVKASRTEKLFFSLMQLDHFLMSQYRKPTPAF